MRVWAIVGKSTNHRQPQLIITVRACSSDYWTVLALCGVLSLVNIVQCASA